MQFRLLPGCQGSRQPFSALQALGDLEAAVSACVILSATFVRGYSITHAYQPRLTVEWGKQ
ncbi:hypothetical protein AXF13_01685 [Desulfovibrio fairfieldensis]|uniref:Uncharacterized protein n=1 Tax=Desulfovibrio fairfieldensis TaxID=44742 RepID=A0A0X8JHU3_9BACT|nr:hypothetical protein AXF13_01685 [Desulfovibrio fairfieldensis]